MNVSSKNDSRTKQNVVFVKQPAWWFHFRFKSFSSGFGRGCIIAIVSLIFSENQSGQFGIWLSWFLIIHLITYWFWIGGSPLLINQPVRKGRLWSWLRTVNIASHQPVQLQTSCAASTAAPESSHCTGATWKRLPAFTSYVDRDMRFKTSELQV